jgi:hypothetical protein
MADRRSCLAPRREPLNVKCKSAMARTCSISQAAGGDCSVREVAYE